MHIYLMNWRGLKNQNSELLPNSNLHFLAILAFKIQDACQRMHWEDKKSE